MSHVLDKIGDKETRKGLYYSLLDGVLWSVMFGFAENYIVPFSLLFGATIFQVSLLQGLAQLSVGISQLFGGSFIVKFKKRKVLSTITVQLHGIMWILLFIGAIIIKSPWIILFFFVAGMLITNIGGPGWVSWMNDLVPHNLRGEFWGMRNRTIGIAQFAAISVAGIILYFSKKYDFELVAYGFLIVTAGISRFCGSFMIRKQHEPPMHVTSGTHEFKFITFLTKLRPTNFGRFVLFSVLMTFSVNLLAPIAPVYALKSLHFNYLQFTVIFMVATIFSMIFMTYWGPLADRFGNYRILFLTSVLLPLLAFGWLFIRNFYLLILLQVLSGFIWAGFNLSTVNYIFDAVRKENISKIMAYFNTLNTSCAFLGAITGGIISDQLMKMNFQFWIVNSFTFVFAVSGLLRIIVILFFIKKFKEVRSTEKTPAAHYFYIYKPVTDIMAKIDVIGKRLFG